MTDVLRISVGTDGLVTGTVSLWIVLVLVLLCIAAVPALKWLRHVLLVDEYEIDEVQLGIGVGTIKIRRNHEVLQMAYKLWIELKTRKLGIPFEEDHDVVNDIYNSWYEFFRLTRELLKSLPVDKVRGDDDTQEIVRISIDVLNKAIRPHLTQWQARFRHWYEREISKTSNSAVTPQDLQRSFPDYRLLIADLKLTNSRLVAYSRMLAEVLEIHSKEWAEVGKK